MYNPEDTRRILAEMHENIKPGNLAEALEPGEERTLEEQEDAAIVETFIEKGWLETSRTQLDKWAEQGTAFIGVDYVLFAEVQPQSETNDTFYFYKTIKRGGEIEELPNVDPITMDAKLHVFKVEKRTQEDVDTAVRARIQAGKKIPRGSDQEILAKTYLTEMVSNGTQWIAPFKDLKDAEIAQALGKLDTGTAPEFPPFSKAEPVDPKADPFADTHLE